MRFEVEQIEFYGVYVLSLIVLFIAVSEFVFSGLFLMGNKGVTSSPCYLSESISKVMMALSVNEWRYKTSLSGFDLDSLVLLSFSLLLPLSSNSKALQLHSQQWLYFLLNEN